MAASPFRQRDNNNGNSSQHRGGRIDAWFWRNEPRLLAASIVSVMFLFFMHLFAATFQTTISNPAVMNAIQIATILPISIVALSVARKGIVPIVICALGVTLIHASIMFPYYSAAGIVGETSLQTLAGEVPVNSQSAVAVAGNMNFFLGIAAVALSLIIAYRPSLLFARNRPPPLDLEWSKYPVWSDNTLLADGSRIEPAIPVKDLMTDQDRYLLWRYEYVLARIYGTPHLVKPEGLVPKDSTEVLRDRESGRVIGKARYPGYFM